MIVESKILHTRKVIEEWRNAGKTIGFVPTMGALHEGHISLVKRSKKENDFTVCSIFVNPTQFNNPDDLKKYPRTFEEDSLILEKEGCDLIFAPTENEMYPVKDNMEYDLGGLDKTMEGNHRPGHFNGVAMIVKKLFEVIQPHNAYFGEKDYQQLMIIRHINDFYKLSVNIVSCRTIREQDGLAMSSRNKRLNIQERKLAPRIYHVLESVKDRAGTLPFFELKSWAENELKSIPGSRLEYFEIADAETLIPVNDWGNNNLREFVAVFIGEIRLIDNMKIFS